MGVITKSKKLEYNLRNSIISGQWGVGDMLPAERVLLDEYGVSRTTLRDALTSLASEGLIVRKPGSGTYVSERLQQRSIAITSSATHLSSATGEWHRSLLTKSQERITGAGQRAQLWISNGLHLDDYLNDLASGTALFSSDNLQNTNGLLNTVHMEGLDKFLASKGIHCVNLASTIPLGRYSVVVDYQAMMQDAKRVLADHGYPDFSVIYEPAWEPSKDKAVRIAQEKQAKYIKAAVDEDESRMIKVCTTGKYNNGNVYQSFRALMQTANRPRALFFTDDSFFDVASRIIVELGIRVPEDLALVTHANIGREFHFPISVTRLGYDADAVIDAAWDMLQKLVAGVPVTKPVRYIKPVLRIGKSL